MSVAVYTLYIDGLHHTWVNKVLLGADLFDAVFYMSAAMYDVYMRKKGWLANHKNHMFLCYISAIEGAGTIRSVSHFHWLLNIVGVKPDSFLYTIFGAGLPQCQRKYKTVWTFCEWAYALRMVWVRFVSNCYIQCYANFTPGMQEVAKSRWNGWIRSFLVFAFAVDQDIKPGKALMGVLVVQTYAMLYDILKAIREEEEE